MVVGSLVVSNMELCGCRCVFVCVCVCLCVFVGHTCVVLTDGMQHVDHQTNVQIFRACCRLIRPENCQHILFFLKIKCFNTTI